MANHPHTLVGLAVKLISDVILVIKFRYRRQVGIVLRMILVEFRVLGIFVHMMRGIYVLWRCVVTPPRYIDLLAANR